MKTWRHVMSLVSKLFANPAVGFGFRAWFIAALVVPVPAPGAQTPAPSSAAAQSTPGSARREPLQKRFLERVNAYVALKKTLDDGLPKLKPGAVSTGSAETHEDVLAARIREARAKATPGDIFGDAAPYFRQVIARDTKTRGASDAKAAMAEVPRRSPLTVNARYPETAALATVPVLILINLPRLPDGLEYRFMGRDLILRDRTANLVVDFIEGAVPAPPPPSRQP